MGAMAIARLLVFPRRVGSRRDSRGLSTGPNDWGRMDRRRIVAIVIAGIAILGACAILPAASGTGHSPGISAPASSKASDPVAPPATPEVAQPTGGAHSHPAAPIHPDITSIITILPNGTLSPATAFISQSGNTYTVVSAFNGGIIDERNGSTVDGAGLTLTTGSGDSTTVEVLGASSVTIEDLVVSGSSTDYAFWVYGSSNVKIIGCNATLAVDAGIDVHDSDTVNLLHDNTSGSGATEAIETYYTSNVLAANNNVSGSEYGVDLEDGNNVTSEHNTAVGDTIPFYLYLDTDVLELGNTAWATTQDVFDTNILSHFAFRWNNASGGGQEGISLEEGGTDGAITHNSFKGTFTKYGVYLSQSDSVNVTDNDLAIGGGGVYAEYANSVGVSSNNVSGDDDGVDIQVLLRNQCLFQRREPVHCRWGAGPRLVRDRYLRQQCEWRRQRRCFHFRLRRVFGGGQLWL